MKKTLMSLVLTLFVASVPAFAQNATLTVIHGIPGQALGQPDESLPVDVYANGGLAFTFDFNESVDNLELPAGEYTFDIYASGTDPETNDPVLTVTAELEEGVNYTAIAHLTFTGTPEAPGATVSLFQNDVSQVNWPQSRLTFRHTANAPEVAIDLRRIPIYPFVGLPSFSNNADEGAESRTIDVNIGTFEANLLYQGSKVFTSNYFTTQPLDNVVIYAIGDFFGGTFRLFVQPIN